MSVKQLCRHPHFSTNIFFHKADVDIAIMCEFNLQQNTTCRRNSGDIATHCAQAGFLWSWISPHMTSLSQYTYIFGFFFSFSPHSVKAQREAGE